MITLRKERWTDTQKVTVRLPEYTTFYTGISRLEAMYGWKLRNRMTQLHPEIREVPAKEIDWVQIAGKQDKMKAHFESKKSPSEINVDVGDFFHTKKPDGWYAGIE